MGVAGGVTCFGVAALAACAVNVEEFFFTSASVIHPAVSFSKGKVDGGVSFSISFVSGAGPVVGVIVLISFLHTAGFDAGETPVVVTSGFALRGALDGFRQGYFCAGVLLPYQAGGEVADGAISIVFVSGCVALVVGVLAEKWIARFWEVDGVTGVKCLRLFGVNNRVACFCSFGISRTG